MHRYSRTIGGYKSGDQCQRRGRADVDGEYRCRQHRLIEMMYGRQAGQIRLPNSLIRDSLCEDGPPQLTLMHLFMAIDSIREEHCRIYLKDNRTREGGIFGYRENSQCDFTLKLMEAYPLTPKRPSEPADALAAQEPDPVEASEGPVEDSSAARPSPQPKVQCPVCGVVYPAKAKTHHLARKVHKDAVNARIRGRLKRPTAEAKSTTDVSASNEPVSAVPSVLRVPRATLP